MLGLDQGHLHPLHRTSETNSFQSGIEPAGAAGEHSIQRDIRTALLIAIRNNDDLFDRLETVRFFRLFTGEGDMENTGRGNTELRGQRLEYCPDCHLAQIRLKRGVGEHVLHCDGSLEGLVITRV
jgi:hypothetical protein